MKKCVFLLMIFAIIISMVGCGDGVKNISKELDDSDIMVITEVTSNDDKYILQGVLYSSYTFSKKEIDKIKKEEGEAIILDGKPYFIRKPEPDDKGYFAGTLLYNLYEEGKEYPLFSIYERENEEYCLKRNAQIDDCYKDTGKKVSITIDKNTPFVENQGIKDLPVTTADTKFENYEPTELKKNVTFPIPSYTFEFSNGKCSLVRANNGI